MFGMSLEKMAKQKAREETREEKQFQRSKKKILKRAEKEARKSGLNIDKRFFSDEIFGTVEVPQIGFAFNRQQFENALNSPGLVYEEGGKVITRKGGNVLQEFNIKKALELLTKGIQFEQMDKNNLPAVLVFSLNCFLWWYNASRIEIDKNAAMVVFWLHKNNYYDAYHPEEDIIDGLKKSLAKAEKPVLSDDEIKSAISFLNKHWVVDIKEGNVKLVERVRVSKNGPYLFGL